MQIFLSNLRGKYCLNDLEIVKRPKKLNYNVEILFKTRYCCPPPPYNFILFEFLRNLKSTIKWYTFYPEKDIFLIGYTK